MGRCLFCYDELGEETFEFHPSCSRKIFGTSIPPELPYSEDNMLQLAEKVIKLTGSKSKLTFKVLPQDDPMQRKPEISLARKELNNWEPVVQLDEGLTYTINYFKKTLNL